MTEQQVQALYTTDLAKMIDDVVYDNGTQEQKWAMDAILARCVETSETSPVEITDARGGIRPTQIVM